MASIADPATLSTGIPAMAATANPAMLSTGAPAVASTTNPALLSTGTPGMTWTATPAGQPSGSVSVALPASSNITQSSHSRPNILASNIIVLRVGPQRKIYAALKSVLIRIPYFEERLKTGQAIDQNITPQQRRMQEETIFMQGQQQKPLPPWTPSKEEDKALTMIAKLSAKMTPREDCEKIRVNYLRNTSPLQLREETIKRGMDPVIVFFRSQALEEHLRQRKAAIVTGSNADSASGDENNRSQGQGQRQPAFLEGNTNVIDSLEEDIVAIEELLHYAHTGRLRNFDSSKADRRSATQFTKTLVYTFILAEKWCLEELGNLAINRLSLHYQKWKASWQDIVSLRESGLADCRMRRMIIQQMISDIRRHGWDAYVHAFKDRGLTFLARIKGGGEDVVDILKMLIDTQEPPNPAHDGNPCDWHMHRNTPKCVAAKNIL